MSLIDSISHILSDLTAGGMVSCARAHILIACGTQRGGANSDALAKFQFRDVGLLAILIGNVHRFPFSLLISVQTALVYFFALIPSL